MENSFHNISRTTRRSVTLLPKKGRFPLEADELNTLVARCAHLFHLTPQAARDVITKAASELKQAAGDSQSKRELLSDRVLHACLGQLPYRDWFGAEARYFARRFRIDCAAAEDLVAQAVLELVSAGHARSDARRKVPLLRTIVARRFIDHLRRRKSEHDAGATMRAAARSRDLAFDDKRVAELFDKARIWSIVYQLSAGDARIILDHLIEGQSFENLAASSGARPASLRKRYERALNRLRVLYRETASGPAHSEAVGRTPRSRRQRVSRR